MARPNSKGLLYFSLDTDFISDSKVRRIISAQGVSAVAVIIELLCTIYREDGYYILRNKDLAFLISDSLRGGVSEGFVEEVINKAIDVGFFDANMNKTYGVLTSKSIQERYFAGTRKRKRVQYDGRFLLISLNDCNNVVNVANNSINGAINEQSKVNKSKVNKSKVNKSKVNKSKVNKSKVNSDETTFLENNSFKLISKLYLENNFGSISGYVVGLINDAINSYGADWVIHAMEEAIKNNARSWRYVEAVLNDWNNKYALGSKPWEIKIGKHSRHDRKIKDQSADSESTDWSTEPDRLTI